MKYYQKTISWKTKGTKLDFQERTTSNWDVDAKPKQISRGTKHDSRETQYYRNKFPGKQSGPNSISRKVQQPTGIVVLNQNKFPGEPNTIPGKQSIIENKFPGKQNGNAQE